MAGKRKRRWEEIAEEDPAAGLLNLFDVWIAFAAALLLAVVGARGSSRAAATELEAQRERIGENPVRIERYRVTDQRAGGEGLRLGTAYRLDTGEVVYVPDEQGR